MKLHQGHIHYYNSVRNAVQEDTGQTRNLAGLNQITYYSITLSVLPQGLSNAIEVACGAAFNLAMCADGAVYSWGVGVCVRVLI